MVASLYTSICCAYVSPIRQYIHTEATHTHSHTRTHVFTYLPALPPFPPSLLSLATPPSLPSLPSPPSYIPGFEVDPKPHHLMENLFAFALAKCSTSYLLHNKHTQISTHTHSLSLSLKHSTLRWNTSYLLLPPPPTSPLSPSPSPSPSQPFSVAEVDAEFVGAHFIWSAVWVDNVGHRVDRLLVLVAVNLYGCV